MAAGRLVVPGWTPAVNVNGVPIPNAQMFFYLNGTTTLATVYADEALTIPLSNPLFANSAGQWAAVWADDANLFSVAIDAPYGPPGVPFTFDDLGPSTSSNAGALNKLDRDGANAEPGVVENIGAAKITGDEFTGKVFVPSLANVTDQVYGQYESAVGTMVAIRSDKIVSNNVKPYVNGFEPNGISTYGSLDAVGLYVDAVVPAGAYMNVDTAVVAYGAYSTTLVDPLDPAIPVGCFIQTKHDPDWWRCEITAISEDRKTIGHSHGWYKRNENISSTPTGTTGMWVNAATRVWPVNGNIFLQPTGPTQSGQWAEIGVVNNRGTYIPDPEGGLVGTNDASGLDIVSFGSFTGARAIRARGNFERCFEVTGVTGGSAFCVSNYATLNPAFGFDWQASTGTPIMVRPFRDEADNPIETYSVGIDGSVFMGRRVTAAPVSLNLFTSGTGTGGTPDAQLFVSGGDAGGFNGTARWRQGAMSFEGNDGTEQFRVRTALGSLSRVSVYGSGPAGPARIVAERVDGGGAVADLSLEATNGGRIRITNEMFKNSSDFKITARNSSAADIGLNIAPSGANSIVPTAASSLRLGSQAIPWLGVVSAFFEFPTGSFITSGTGSPNGAVTGNPGCMYLNVSGGAGTTLWVKESGTGNTGWVAK